MSGARAPRFRRGWTPPPEPTEEEFKQELRRLEGVPEEALEDEDLLRVILPALRADTALYRNYIYTERPPLACPIHVYGGESDPNIKPEHLAAWQEHTTCAATVRLFPGGHFFLQSAQKEFLAALATDLSAVCAMTMRILLAHNSLYYPSFGGGDKSNRLLMEALAALGHDVRVVARVEHFGAEAHDHLLAELAARSVAVDTSQGASIRFRLNGVQVSVLTRDPMLRAYFAAQIRGFDPDVIVTSTDDPAHLMLDTALRSPRARVVYLVRATIALPFGPDSSFPSAAKTAGLRRTDGAVAVSEYVAAYAREWGQMDAVHVPDLAARARRISVRAAASTIAS